MNEFEEFLRRLLNEGRVVFRGRPEAEQPQGQGMPAGAEAVAVLREAFESHRLEVAGPAIPFDETVACAAGELVRQACWALVSHAEPVPELERRLTMPRPPRSPSQHLSADLLFRHLPQIHRRARAIAASDPIVAALALIMRQWPLSGVLSDIEEGPLAPLDLGHPGLWLLYAERLSARDRPAWRPEGPAREYLDLVLQERGRGRGPAAGATAAVAGRNRDA
jgi:hypothetical protein